MICAVSVQLIATLLSEIVLSCKEVNQKSRAAANEVLVSIAYALDEAKPATALPGAPIAVTFFLAI